MGSSWVHHSMQVLIALVVLGSGQAARALHLLWMVVTFRALRLRLNTAVMFRGATSTSLFLVYAVSESNTDCSVVWLSTIWHKYIFLFHILAFVNTPVTGKKDFFLKSQISRWLERQRSPRNITLITQRVCMYVWAFVCFFVTSQLRNSKQKKHEIIKTI